MRRNVRLDQRDRVEGGGEGGDRKLAHDVRVEDVVGRAEQERAVKPAASTQQRWRVALAVRRACSRRSPALTRLL